MSQSTFFPSVRASLLAGLTVASLLAATISLPAQEPLATAPGSTPAQAAGAQSPADSVPSGADTAAEPQAATPQAGTTPQADASVTALPANGTGRIKEKQKTSKLDRIIPSKDTKKALTREKKLDPIAAQDANLPDRQLYDKALGQIKKGHFDVARLELQNMLATYPDSQYQMRAKLAIADSWYKEGGTAALAQAEAEYSDFRVFFPNAPEAAEAQMRIGDIYFRQMDKPDRDYAKAVHAEEEYRRMLTDYPESKLIPQAKQRLREVQEMLATREASIADFYTTRSDWPAAIARYKTVLDTYPLYSHMDDVLIGIGDSYEAEARAVRAQNLPEAAKARLETDFDGKAAAAYRAVVLDHSASPHVEDARDRLDMMHLAAPTPSVDQAQYSQALENSRSTYHLQDRARLLFFHQPDVVSAARMGDPPLADPKATFAPAITREIVAEFNEALRPGSTTAVAATTAAAPAETDAATPAPANTAAPLAFQDVQNSDGSTTATDGAVTGAATTTGTPTNSVGVEIVSPGTSDATGSRAIPTASGLNGIGPAANAALPPIEKPGEAPDQVNAITPGATQPAAQVARADGKKTKGPAFDKSDESSSKHKKKKGLDKLNPL